MSYVDFGGFCSLGVFFWWSGFWGSLREHFLFLATNWGTFESKKRMLGWFGSILFFGPPLCQPQIGGHLSLTQGRGEGVFSAL